MPDPVVDPNQVARDWLSGKDLGIPPDDRKPIPPVTPATIPAEPVTPVAATPATPATPAAPGAPATPATPAPTLTLEAIEAKIQLGQDLTDEEAKFIEDQEKVLPPAEPLPVYRIAGEQIEYADAEKRAREGMKLPADMVLPRETVETWVRAQNKTEFAKSNGKTAEINAQAREALIEQERVLLARERDLIEKKAEHNAMVKDLNRKTEELQRKKMQLDRIIASKPRHEDVVANPQDVNLMIQYQDGIRAERDYAELQADHQRISADTARANEEGQRIEGERLLVEANSFAVKYPQYLPSSGDFIRTYSAFLRSDKLSDEDTEKMWEVNRIFMEAAYSNMPYERTYSLMKKAGHLIVKDVQTGSNGQAAAQIPPPLNKIEESMKRIQRIRERQTAAPSRVPAGARSSEANRITPSAEEVARKALEAERVLQPGGGSPTGLWDGTLSTQQKVVSS
jgi:hypothetical protein